jgi:integrase
MTEKLHLLRRGGIWWFQVAVPRSQHSHPAWGGKKIVSISLKTGDLATARAERNKLMGEFQQKVDRIKSGGLTAADIAGLAERIKAVPLTVLRSPQERSFGPAYIEISRRLKEQIEAEIAAVSEREGVPINPGTVEKALMAVLHDAKQRATFGKASTPPPPAAQAVEAETVSDETVSRAAEVYIKELQHKKKNIGKAALNLRRVAARLFVSYSGDPLVSSVTIAQAKDFMNRITQFSPTWRGDNFAEIEKKYAGGERQLSVLTTNGYAMALKAIFRSATRRGTYRGSINPFDDLHQAGAQAESYVAFEIDELNKLFADAKFLVKPKRHNNQTALPWLLLLGLYTGARIEELAQLSVADVREKHGLTVLDIHERNGNSLKSESAERLIPLHPAVIKAGFLRYVAALPKNGRLFPGLRARASRGGKLGTNVGESFGRWRKRLGLTRERLAFHSLRHNTGEALERAGFVIEESDAARVLGHRLKNVTFGVYSKAQLQRVAKTVKKINYPGLALPAAK